MACTDNIVSENLDYCPTDEIAAGVSEVEIYAAFVSDFDVIQEPAALSAATSYAEAATIDVAHTFPLNGGFFKLNVLPDTGNVESQLVGPKGSKSYTNVFTGTLPGTSARNLGFGRKAKNAGMIFLVKQTNGDIRQIGSATKPAYFEEFNANSGTTAEDVNGVPFSIQDTQPYPAPIYNSTITEFTAV
jgi:hypothetical protein